MTYNKSQFGTCHFSACTGMSNLKKKYLEDFNKAFNSKLKENKMGLVFGLLEDEMTSSRKKLIEK